MKRAILTITVVCLGMTVLCSNVTFARGGAPSGGGHSGGGGGGHPGGGGGGGGHPGGGGGGGGQVHVNNNAVHNVNSGIQTHVNNNNQVHLNNGMNHTNLNHSAISGSPQIGHHTGFNPTTTSNLVNQSNVNHFNQNHLNNVNLQQHHTNINNLNHNNLNHNVNNVNNVNINKNNNFSNNNFNHQNFNHNNFNHNFNHQNFSNNLQFANHHVNLASAQYKPAFYNHSGYYHGYWHGGWGPWAYGHGYGWGGYGWGGYGNPYRYWGYQPYYWGLGGWGLGSLIYGSGYQSYYNPYYVSSPALCYNYSQPIPVAYNQDISVPAQNLAANGTDALDSAVAAFKQNNYDAALDIVNQGITQSPTDSVLHEFRALVLFAKGDYQQSAATIHSVLAVGPGWDWTTLSGLYTDVGIYTNQLRALEAAVKQNPNDAAQHFLLGYHYMSDGYNDAAAKQFQQVATMMPNDNVASNMLKMLTTTQQVAQTTDQSGQPIPPGQPTPQPPATNLPGPGNDVPGPSNSAAPPIDPNTIVGNWKSSRTDGSKFALSLGADNNFKWTFTPKSQPPQSFDGTYTVDGNVIALERTGGGSLVAEITDLSSSKFNFKMVGAPEEDPGLTFMP